MVLVKPPEYVIVMVADLAEVEFAVAVTVTDPFPEPEVGEIVNQEEAPEDNVIDHVQLDVTIRVATPPEAV